MFQNSFVKQHYNLQQQTNNKNIEWDYQSSWYLNRLQKFHQSSQEKMNVYINEKKMREYDHKHEARENLFSKFWWTEKDQQDL